MWLGARADCNLVIDCWDGAVHLLAGLLGNSHKGSYTGDSSILGLLITLY